MEMIVCWFVCWLSIVYWSVVCCSVGSFQSVDFDWFCCFGIFAAIISLSTYYFCTLAWIAQRQRAVRARYACACVTCIISIDIKKAVLFTWCDDIIQIQFFLGRHAVSLKANIKKEIRQGWPCFFDLLCQAAFLTQMLYIYRATSF